MIFIMMSGLFTPIDSMSEWAKVVAYLNSATFFIEVVVLKGSALTDKKISFSYYMYIRRGVEWLGYINYKKTSLVLLYLILFKIA
jgi:ABC-2 type transport system permease protein